MRPFSLLGINLCVLLLSLTVACTGDKAKELLETAEFEERQMNLPHAKQLYEDLIRLYPTSKEADTARARLTALIPAR
jgi:TolA-binding protein